MITRIPFSFIATVSREYNCIGAEGVEETGEVLYELDCEGVEHFDPYGAEDVGIASTIELIDVRFRGRPVELPTDELELVYRRAVEASDLVNR